MLSQRAFQRRDRMVGSVASSGLLAVLLLKLPFCNKGEFVYLHVMGRLPVLMVRVESILVSIFFGNLELGGRHRARRCNPG